MTEVNNVATGNDVVASSDVLSMGIASADHLTADGMLLYMQTRLTGIDEQIEAAFTKQQLIEKERKALMGLQTATGRWGTEGGTLMDTEHTAANAALDSLEAADEGMHDGLTKELETAGLMENGELKSYLNAEQVAAFNTSVGNRLKQLESSASLEMIQLQSLMSARQTAIQLCTNMVSGLGKGLESIVANIAR